MVWGTLLVMTKGGARPGPGQHGQQSPWLPERTTSQCKFKNLPAEIPAEAAGGVVICYIFVSSNNSQRTKAKESMQATSFDSHGSSVNK
jgi:hypothetical protein